MPRGTGVLVLCFYLLSTGVQAVAQRWSLEHVGTGTKPEIALNPAGEPRIAFMTEADHGIVFFDRRGDDGWRQCRGVGRLVALTNSR